MDNYTISKELVEAVLDLKGYITSVNVVGNNIEYYGTHEMYPPKLYTESIDTFFFKCKKWAKDKGHFLHSYPIKNSKYMCAFGYDIMMCPAYAEESDTEQQAVFDACQWILENKFN